MPRCRECNEDFNIADKQVEENDVTLCTWCDWVEPVKVIKEQPMTYKITAEVDEQWLKILGQITKHQEGFVWIKVDER